MDSWRKIPGYGGAYEISDMGNVRSWRSRGRRRAEKPHLMTPFMHRRRGGGDILVVKLTDENGVSRSVSVMGLMAEVWLGGKRKGEVAYHKNGNLRDNWAGNIAFTSRRELGRKSGANARRIPVVKVTPEGEVVAAYPSVRAAARENHMSYQAALDRCNGKIKNPFALDGHTYRFDR